MAGRREGTSILLKEHFDRYFEVVRVRSEAERDEVFRLRFAVYCDELKYEESAAFPDGRERDDYDADAEFALLRSRADGRVVGCVRLILAERSPGERLPFERVCTGHLSPEVTDLSSIDRARSGEISRLAVHAEYRRRAGEWSTAEAVGDPEHSSGGMRRFPIVPMALFLSAAAMGLNLGLHQVFVLMEPRLARLLTGCGLLFEQVGDFVDHHGRRGPFRIDRNSLSRGLLPDAQAFLLALQQRLG